MYAAGKRSFLTIKESPKDPPNIALRTLGAPVDKAVELGVTDPERVGVSGHSHGALMTANLLAYSNLFRAGVARSGAYNHTLRPFGFQTEHRTFYKARDTYLKLSPRAW